MGRTSWVHGIAHLMYRCMCLYWACDCASHSLADHSLVTPKYALIYQCCYPALDFRCWMWLSASLSVGSV